MAVAQAQINVCVVQLIVLLIYIFIANSQLCKIQPNVSLPIPMIAHQSAYDIGSRAVYIFGGLHLDTIYKWDISQDQWTQLGTTPTSTFYSFSNSAVTINDIVYFVAIRDGLQNSGIVYRFNISAEQWLDTDSIASPLFPCDDSCVTENTTHILTVGGRRYINGSPAYVDQLQIYNILTDMWTTETINIPPIQNNGWVAGYCHSVGTDLYTFGGISALQMTMDKILKYTPNDVDKWTDIGTLPATQCCSKAIYHEEAGVIYIVGGYNDGSSEYFNTVHVFDLRTQNITTTLTIQPKSNPAVEIIYDKLHIFGGGQLNGPEFDTIETCEISGFVTTTTTSYPTTATSHPATFEPTAINTTDEQTTNRSAEMHTTFITTDDTEVFTTTEEETTDHSTPIAPSHTAFVTAEENEAEVMETTTNDSGQSTGDDSKEDDLKLVVLSAIIGCVSILVSSCCCGCIYVLKYRKNKVNKQDKSHMVQECDDDQKVTVAQEDKEKVMKHMIHSEDAEMNEVDSEKKKGDILMIQRENDHAEGASPKQAAATLNVNMECDEFEVIGDDETSGNQY